MAPTSEVTDVYPPPFDDLLTAIAWLAGQSQDLLFATSVLVVPYRHPLLTARVSAMLHEISGGRFALGVGVVVSHRVPGSRADYARRGQITDDYLQALHHGGGSGISTPTWLACASPTSPPGPTRPTVASRCGSAAACPAIRRASGSAPPGT